MSVERYTAGYGKDNLGFSYPLELRSSSSGEYVAYADYEALQQQRTQLLEALKRCATYLDSGNTTEMWSQCRVCGEGRGHLEGAISHRKDCWYQNIIAAVEQAIEKEV